MSPSSPSVGKKVRALGLVSIIIGAVMIIAGAVTWGMVSTKLAAENITVSADAPMLAGARVTGPIEAFVQADVINGHALKATGGKITHALAIGWKNNGRFAGSVSGTDQSWSNARRHSSSAERNWAVCPPSRLRPSAANS